MRLGPAVDGIVGSQWVGGSCGGEWVVWGYVGVGGCVVMRWWEWVVIG